MKIEYINQQCHISIVEDILCLWPGTDVNVQNYPNKNSNDYLFNLDVDNLLEMI